MGSVVGFVKHRPSSPPELTPVDNQADSSPQVNNEDPEPRVTTGEFKMSKAKILIVDDDPDLRRALQLRLRANKYDTVHAPDGYAAIAMAQKEKPHLIILDLGLPAGDGFVVLDRLQNHDALAA